eukprot:CAMPEP_0171064686 /NCGR_PEP_ID=MMETSP0766_2-20121228/6439_1 /TAXON_ID=439317 /ORGANISM="Gambierdiscus australes, Strain CAWD 149" /LENGTH=416 /DNA_ID=CAMNT_0011520747 /DNA_START=75 /DNA_END=1325 /DNA_ORIENTATION=-
MMARALSLTLWAACYQAAAANDEVHQSETMLDAVSLLQKGHLLEGATARAPLSRQDLPAPPTLLQHGASAELGVRPLKSVAINLDLPPEERWPAALGDTLKILGPMARNYPVDRRLLDDVDFTPDEEFVAEMRGIVKAVNSPYLTLEHLLANELSYERGFTACTGVLVATSNGTVFHGRNLDLQPNLRDALQSCTFDATFYRGGKPLFSATLMGVGIGIHTGYRIGSYSIAQNTRQGCGDVDLNVEAARRGGRPFPLLVRRILQDVASYDEAVHRLAETPLIAPQYFTVAGAGAWEGSLVTRDRHGYSAPYPNVETLSPQIGRWFIVQTNDDTWKPPVDERRPTALAKLSSMGPSSTSAETVLEVMTTEPVLNTGTVFTWVLQPSTGARKVFLGSDELRGDVAVPAFVSNIRPPTR